MFKIKTSFQPEKSKFLLFIIFTSFVWQILSGGNSLSNFPRNRMSVCIVLSHLIPLKALLKPQETGKAWATAAS